MTFAKMLRDGMAAKGLNARQLAERVELASYHGVYKWRTGDRRPELPTLRQVVEVLDLDRREAFFGAFPEARWFLEEEENSP